MDTVAKPQYDNGVVKYLTVGAIVFLVLGTFMGTFAASQLAWPALNFDIAEITFARLRVMHTNTVYLRVWWYDFDGDRHFIPGSAY
jgi:Cbb3-type cytochrome oxidase, subunit 1